MLPPKTSEIPQLYARAMALQKAGQGAEALAIYQRILLARPNTPEVLFQIGRIQAAGGKTDKAETALRKALALKPKEAVIWQALAGVLSGGAAKKLAREAARAGIVLGSEADVEPILRQIAKAPAKAEVQALVMVKSAPEAFWPAYALGRARAAQSNWAGALGPLDMAHQRDPSHAETRLHLGLSLAKLGQPARAEHLLRPLVGRSRAARVGLSHLYADTLRFDLAAELLREGAPHGPKAPGLDAELALAEAALGQADAAFKAAQWAVKAGTDPVGLYLDLGKRFQDFGAIKAAHAAVDAALSLHPGDPALLSRHAALLQSDGDLAWAEAQLTQALAQDPTHAEAYRAYMAGRKVTADDPVLPKLHDQLARPDLGSDARRILNFAAAKAAGDMRQTDQVFEHLHRANRLMAEANPYSFEADLDEARALVADWPLLKELPPGEATDPVFFVTGLPRSGTTLVETILAAHPQVAAAGEMPFLNRALALGMETLRAGKPDADTFAQGGARYIETGRRRTGAALFTDKAISTFSRIGHAATALPGARFFILKRDHRDVGLSIYRNMFAEGTHRYSTDLAQMGRYMRLHDALVAFWAEALPDRVKIVDYEALTADPEPIIRDMIAFAGLPWDDACLAPEKAQRRVDTLSFAQVRQPIGRQAVAGWRKYEAQLQPLIEALDCSFDLTSDA